jgi:phosphohistidine phosphatase
MKRLTLIRHAQAEDKLLGQRDWDRPLTKRGISDATEMAKRLKTKRLKPTMILSSPATRTVQTSHLFAEQLSNIQIETHEQLYLATYSQLLKFVQSQNHQINHLLIMGHNPGVTEFADLISAQHRIDSMPTASIVTMKLNIDSWQDLIPAIGVNVEFDYLQK